MTGSDNDKSKPDMYEDDAIVSVYVEFHYGKMQLGVENFPVQCISELSKLLPDATTRPRLRALDIGCATGRSSFELAKLGFAHVDAVDYSARLIGVAETLQTAGVVAYSVQDEGALRSAREARLSDFDGYDDVKRRVHFAQGDACALRDDYDAYDAVFAGNLIDRLYDPHAFLRGVKARVRRGGLLAIASPYTWLEEFTPRRSWVGGFKADTGENLTTLEGLRDALAPDFESAGDAVDVPMVIRETRRKFQYTFSQLSFWRKVGGAAPGGA